MNTQRKTPILTDHDRLITRPPAPLPTVNDLYRPGSCPMDPRPPRPKGMSVVEEEKDIAYTA